LAYYGIEFLRNRLAAREVRVRLRYGYYEMKQEFRKVGSIIPPEFNNLDSVLGWCERAVDLLADRIVFEGFSGDDFYMTEIFSMNNQDIFTAAGIKDALIGSCSFIYISADKDGYPRLQVIDGANATGILDPITNLLTEGYAVIERDQRYYPFGEPTVEAYFTKEATYIYRAGKLAGEYPNPADYALLVPLIYKPSAKRPFGHSRISRACMSLVDSSMRTLWRSEVAAEFYSFPQKYVLGLQPNAKNFDKWALTIASFMRFDQDSKGNHPVVGQFQQQSMLPYTEQLKMFASAFAGETSLTLDDLGFSTANPSTAEAIKAAHENLRLTAAAAQRCFGTGFINAGYLAACLRDKRPYDRYAVRETTAEWLPIFTPEPSELGALGDAVGKLQTAFPDYFTEEKLHRLTGL
jgi:hypothetical protein